jgi:pimeloyl-ACP methyl ester carboxylesterase
MPITTAGTAYDLTGPADAPVVVLIHGLGLTRDSTWAAITPPLAKEFRVLRYDLCGHGETALPQGRVDLTLLSVQLIALMDALEVERAALVGFSLGGMINRRCAMDHPDRVSALAILNAPHDRGEERQRIVEAQARAAAAGGPAANLDQTLARWFTEGFRRHHAENVAQIRDIVLANDPENYAAHRQVLAEGVKELTAPVIPIRHPTLVMTCARDSGSTPAMANAIAREIPDAEAIIVPDLQHLGLIEAPDIFADILLGYLGRILNQPERDMKQTG